jgi:hypothetical protein
MMTTSLLLHCIAIFTFLAKELYFKPITVKEEQSIYFVDHGQFGVHKVYEREGPTSDNGFWRRQLQGTLINSLQIQQHAGPVRFCRLHKPQQASPPIESDQMTAKQISAHIVPLQGRTAVGLVDGVPWAT